MSPVIVQHHGQVNQETPALHPKIGVVLTGTSVLEQSARYVVTVQKTTSTCPILDRKANSFGRRHHTSTFSDGIVL